MKPHPPGNYREAYDLAGEDALRKEFLDYALANGILLVSTCTGMLSTAMTSKEVDHLADVVERAFRTIRPALLTLMEIINLGDPRVSGWTFKSQ